MNLIAREGLKIYSFYWEALYKEENQITINSLLNSWENRVII